MTDYKISQLTTATPAAADLIAFVDVDDTSTAPAGAGGSDKATTITNLATALGVTAADSTAAHIQPDGVRAAGAQGLAADSAHVHPEQANQSNLLMPSGGLAETFPRWLSSVNAGPSSSLVSMTAIPLPKGLTVTNITFITGSSAESGGTHGWYALMDSSGKVLAVSADQTGATVWGSANAPLTLAMGTPYVTPSAGTYYVAVSVTATGMPTFASNNLSVTSASRQVPMLCGSAGNQAAPPAVNATFSISSATNCFYAYVS